MANSETAVEKGGQTGRINVLFFSRGRGRGHAVPDLAIAEAVPGIQGNIDIRFASYATGAETFRQAGRPVMDLGLPEANPYTRTLLIACKLIEKLRPDIVVSHEEFSVLPAAHFADVPCVLITDWFPAATQASAEAIPYADAIIFCGEAGIFPLPAPTHCTPVVVGPIVRRMGYSLQDRARARRELGLGEKAFVVSVMPGSWATEEKSPIGPIIFPAFARLAVGEKHLLWLSKADQASLQKQANGIPQLRLIPDCPTPDQIMVASDLIITKGNRGTILDATSLGVPSLSLSAGANSVDEILVARIRSNLAFNARAMDAGTLYEHLARFARKSPGDGTPLPGAPVQGGEAAARALVAEINRLLSPQTGSSA